MPDVVVIGAGIAGLAAAHALRDRDVLVIDGSGRVGGKLRTSAIAGLDVDEGAEAFLARVPEGLALAGAVGLGAALAHPATTSASLWARGALRPIPRGTVFGVPASLRSLSGILTPAETARAAADLVLPAGDGGDVSVGHLVGRRLGRAVVDRLVDPLLGGVYAGRADLLSSRATLPQLAGAHGSLIRAAARATAGRQRRAGVRHGDRRDGALAEAVAAGAGARMVLGRLVRRIERTPTGFRVVHGPDHRRAGGRGAGGGGGRAGRGGRPAPRRRRARGRGRARAGRGGESGHRHDRLAAARPARSRRQRLPGAGLRRAAGQGRDLLLPQVGRTSTVATSWSCAARSVGTATPPSCTATTTTSSALAVGELRRTVGATGSPVESRVTRWGGGLPQYAVGHLDRIRRVRAAVADVPGLAVCGATYDGVGIPPASAPARRRRSR